MTSVKALDVARLREQQFLAQIDSLRDLSNFPNIWGFACWCLKFHKDPDVGIDAIRAQTYIGLINGLDEDSLREWGKGFSNKLEAKDASQNQ